MYKKQLEEEIKTAGEVEKNKIRQELAQIEEESFEEFEKNQREYKRKLKQIEEQVKKAEKILENKEGDGKGETR